ncbi:MAG: hypothetical protein ACLGPL_07650, partial [Acidobacteriota bacterium]
MTHQEEIVPGTVLEFFESKDIVCGVCIAVKSQRLTVLTEQNRETNMARSRLIHFGTTLNTKLGRDDLVRKLTEISALRRSLMEEVNLEELWTLLEGESEGYEARDLSGFIFSESLSEHHVAAVQRTLLQDRLFFQYKDSLFHPRPAEKVEQRRLEMAREEEREAQLEQGSQWLKAAWTKKGKMPLLQYQDKVIDALNSFCLFGQDSNE